MNVVAEIPGSEPSNLSWETTSDIPTPETAKIICVTTSPSTFKVAKVVAEDLSDLFGIVQTSALTWLNYRCEDMLEESLYIARKFGFSEPMIRGLVDAGYEGFEDLETEMGMVMPAIHVEGLDVDVNPVLLLMKDNLIITIHGAEVNRFMLFSRYTDTWFSKLAPNMPTEDKMSRLLARLIEVNNARNFEQLRHIEEKADDISEALLDPTIHYMETGRFIFQVKHNLIIYLNALWRSLDLLNNLRYGDAELLSDSPKVLHSFNVLADNLVKHISLTEHTSNILVSGTTVLQTLHNNQLLIINNRMLMVMTWVTIIATAVLVPNTLATLFAYVYVIPPEHLWWTFALICILTIAACDIVYLWMKRSPDLVVVPEDAHTSAKVFRLGH